MSGLPVQRKRTRYPLWHASDLVSLSCRRTPPSVARLSLFLLLIRSKSFADLARRARNATRAARRGAEALAPRTAGVEAPLPASFAGSTT